MSRRRVEDLMRRTMAGEDISSEPGVGDPILTTEPIEVTDGSDSLNSAANQSMKGPDTAAD